MKQLFAFPRYRFRNTRNEMLRLKPVSQREREKTRRNGINFVRGDRVLFLFATMWNRTESPLLGTVAHLPRHFRPLHVYRYKEYQYLLRHGTKMLNRRPLQVQDIVSRFMFVTYAINFSTSRMLSKL